MNRFNSTDPVEAGLPRDSISPGNDVVQVIAIAGQARSHRFCAVAHGQA